MALRNRPRALYALLLVGGLTALGLGWYTLGGTAGAVPAGRYVEGVVGRPQRPTPLFARANDVDGDVAALLFSGLTRIEGDGVVLPDLAERWEVTPDGLTYTFYLRPNLVWHDGAPLDAHDVAFTVATVQSPGFEGPSALAARWAGIEVTVANPRTILFRLPAPTASFLSLAALGIVPEHLLRGMSQAELAALPANRAAVGSGPFRLAQLDVNSAVLERNLTYHHGIAALDRIELRFYDTSAALARALERREIDGALLDRVPPTDMLGAVLARPDLRVTPMVESSYSILYLNNQRAPLTDPALRRAVAAAIDRAGLIRPEDPAQPGDGPIVPGVWAYAPGGWSTAEQAEALFVAAGWTRGTDGARQRGGVPLAMELLTNDDPARAELATGIAIQLRALGLEINVRALPAGALLRDHIDTREYDLLLFAWQADVDPDPFGGWHTSQIATGGRNVAGFHDAQSDALLEQARFTMDTTERSQLYAQWSARFVELAPSVVLAYPRRLYVQPRTLEGTTGGVLFTPGSRFHDAHLWHVAPTR